jgi:hypothetical protein
MTRAYNTATTQQNSGGAVPPITAGKNAVINGGFDIWQRGTSIAQIAATTAYTTDRWACSTPANGATTISRQPTNDTTNLPFIQYCARIQRNSGQTGTDGIAFQQNFESANSIPFAGKTITMSFYARAGANYSPTSNALRVYLFSGTGTDQNIASGFTGQTQVINQTATLTTTWQRFTYTATVGATVTQLAPYFLAANLGTAGANDYYEITGVQLEVGSIATPFSRNAGTIQGEIAACQRYYQRFTSGTLYGTMANVGYANSSTIWYGNIQLIVPMRVTPTALDQGGSFRLTNGPGYTVGTLTLQAGVNSPTNVQIGGTTSGMTTYHYVYLQGSNDAAAYIGFSAEL